MRRHFAQILETSIKCDEKVVIHRVIKPENIFPDFSNDEAKLNDFGLASETQEEPIDSFKVRTVQSVKSVSSDLNST